MARTNNLVETNELCLEYLCENKIKLKNHLLGLELCWTKKLSEDQVEAKQYHPFEKGKAEVARAKNSNSLELKDLEGGSHLWSLE